MANATGATGQPAAVPAVRNEEVQTAAIEL